MFTHPHRRCYSAEDRAALIAVICSWYTDHQAGEDDPERLQQLGQHKFETFVRHDLAPAIERQEAGEAARMALFFLFHLFHFIFCKDENRKLKKKGEAARVGFICAAVTMLPMVLITNSSSDSTLMHTAMALVIHIAYPYIHIACFTHPHHRSI